jgi:hypothetical protein
MVFKTYINKTNTVISGSEINTGKNPVSELYYGATKEGDWVYSRLLIQLNIEKLINLHNDGMLGDLTKVKHTLKLVNTGSFHDNLYNKKTDSGKHRTSGFKLVVYELPDLGGDNWYEGVGYDYERSLSGNDVVSTEGSNWFKANTAKEWSLEGLSLLGVDEVEFPNGNEDFELDVTDYVNGLINGNPNHGLAIAFQPELEQKPETITTKDINRGLQYVGFFTNNTQTFYEPQVETKYLDYIRDDRRNFLLDKTNKLYLYVNANGEPKNLDTLPTVNVINDMGETLQPNGDVLLTDNTVTHEKKGVYSVPVKLNLTNFRGPTYFSDSWTNISVDGQQMGDVQMGFEIVAGKTFYDIGMGVERPRDYKVVISGIRHGESIRRGDVRRILTNAMIPFTVDQKVLLDGINYRLYVKEGNIEHTVIDFEPVERSYKDNYILLDTDSLLPNVYYMDIQMESNQEIKTSKEVIKFQVVE